jgi:hypothetical protein
MLDRMVIDAREVENLLKGSLRNDKRGQQLYHHHWNNGAGPGHGLRVCYEEDGMITSAACEGAFITQKVRDFPAASTS